MLLDEGTFGGSRAAITLAKILNEKNDPKMTKTVCSVYAKFTGCAHEIRRGIRQEVFQGTLFSLWLNDRVKFVEENDYIDDKCKSYLINLMKTFMKRVRRGEFEENQ